MSSVTDMEAVFNTPYKGDISKWDDVSSVTTMFSHSQFDGDISGWDVSSVTNMSCMFRESQFDGDVSSVTDRSRIPQLPNS